MDPGQARRALAWLQTVAESVHRRVDESLGTPGFSEVVGMGADGTPTLRVDADAESVVLDALAEAPLPLNLVSEEIQRQEHGAEWTLLVDPVDGSRNIARGIPFYCVALSIGRVSQHDVAVALVRNLATGQVYSAVRGGGAHLDGDPLRVRPPDQQEVIVSAQLQYEPELAAAVRPGMHVRSMGASALETCLVAQGALDAFLARKAFLRIIDVSAAALILEESGGFALDAAGARFDADFDVRKRIAFVGVGDKTILEAIG